MDQQQSPEPSLLEYARFYGIATNFTAVNPFSYVDHTCEISHQSIIPDHDQEESRNQSAFGIHLSTAHASIEETPRKEKLNISKDDAQFLSGIIRNAKTKTTTNVEDIDWESHLLSSRNRQTGGLLKLEMPLLRRTDDEHEFNAANRTLSDHDEIDLSSFSLNAGAEDSELEDLGFLDHIFQETGEVARRIQTEKLDCARDSLLLIQDIKRCGNLGATDIEAFFESALGSLQTRDFAINSPLLRPLDFYDISYKSPVTKAKSHMLPSPASSDMVGRSQVRHGDAPEPCAPIFQPLKTVHGDLEVLEKKPLEQKDMKKAFKPPLQNDSPASSWKSQDVVFVEQIDMSCLSDKGECRENRTVGLRTVDKSEVHPSGFDYGGSISGTYGQKTDISLDRIGCVSTQDVKNDDLHGIIVISSSPSSPRVDSMGICPSPTEGSMSSQLVSRKPDERQSLYQNEESCLEDPEKEQIPPAALNKQIPENTKTEQALHNDNCPLFSKGHADGNSDMAERNTRVQSSSVTEMRVDETIAKTVSPNGKNTQSTEPAACTKNGHALQPKKRKLEKAQTNSKKQQRKSSRGKSLISQPGQRRTRNDPAPSSAFTALGSLASFMETRGITIKSQGVQSNPYFANPADKVNNEQVECFSAGPIEASIDHGDSDEQPLTFDPNILTTLTLAAQSRGNQGDPNQDQNQNREPPLLFLSTTLLKTHIQLIRYLEGMPNPPTLIYRDYHHHNHHHHQMYGGGGAHPQSQINKNNKPSGPEPFLEADIIISPSTGIILTTSQALTQVYLPGHKSSCPQVSGIKEINSPLRERIFRVSNRYERLYVFVCQSVDATKDLKMEHNNKHQGKPESKSKSLIISTADKRTLSSMNELNTFCTSLAGNRLSDSYPYPHSSTVAPILIPATPEIITNWILELANKHAFKSILPGNISIREDENVPPHNNTIGFTPINKNNLPNNNVWTNSESRYHRLYFQHEETNWELSLREVGLNPFAAQTVLGVLRIQIPDHGRGLMMDQDYGNGNSHALGLRGEAMLGNDDASAVSRFIEMPSEQRRCLFGELIGDGVLKSVEAVIDRNWQFDWAVDFDVAGDI